MARKKVSYYSLSLKKSETDICVDNKILKHEVNKIIKNNCDKNDGLEHIILQGELSSFERITMDIISNDEDYLFGRLGKLKGNGEVLVRDLKTNKANGIATDNVRPEIYTYFLLDYNYGILGYLNNSSIPKPDVITNIFSRYNDSYCMNIDNIVNPKTVMDLMKPGSELGKIEYRYKIPNIYILEELGLDKETVVELEDLEYDTISISINNEPRKKLTKENKKIKKLIELFDKNGIIQNKLFKGNTLENTSQNFKFDIDNFCLFIDVPKDGVVNGKIKIYSLEEITEQVSVRMKEKYKNNRKHILRLAGIE